MMMMSKVRTVSIIIIVTHGVLYDHCMRKREKERDMEKAVRIGPELRVKGLGGGGVCLARALFMSACLST